MVSAEEFFKDSDDEETTDEADEDKDVDETSKFFQDSDDEEVTDEAEEEEKKVDEAEDKEVDEADDEEVDEAEKEEKLQESLKSFVKKNKHLFA